MKKLQLTSILLTFLLVVLGACQRPTPEPTPKPNPEPNKPTPSPDKPSKFVPLLVFNEEGALAKLPIGFSDFRKGQAECKAWEKEYASTLKKDDKKVLVYITNDPKNQNPMRIYLFNKDGLLQTSSLSVESKLIFSDSGDINDDVQLLLHKEGYKAVEGKENTYNNGTFLLSIQKGKNAAQLYYSASTTPAPIDFVENANDFPLLLLDKYPRELTLDEIKAHENKIALRSVFKENGRVYNFATPKENASKVNFQIVEYDCRDTYSGKADDGAIIAVSLSIANIDMLRQEKIEKVLINKGFVFQKEDNYGGIKVLSYSNEKAGYLLRVTNNMKGVGTKFTFRKSKIIKDNKEDPKAKRQALYIPIFEAFGMPLTKDSPIVGKEKARGFSTTFYPSTKEIASFPPFDKDYSNSYNKKAGVMMIIYSKEYGGDDSSTIKEINISMNKKWNETRTPKDPELKAFLEKNGFTYKGLVEVSDGKGLKLKMESFHNKDKEVFAWAYKFPLGKEQFIKFKKNNPYTESRSISIKGKNYFFK